MTDREPDTKPTDVLKIPASEPAARDIDAPAAPKRWTELDPTEQARRIQDAAELSQLHGVKCTGVPEQTDCGEPAIIAIVLHGRLYSLPCLAHVEPIGRYIMRQGHGSFRQVSIAELLEVHGDRFVKSAEAIRDRNIAYGIALAPGAYQRRKGS